MESAHQLITFLSDFGTSSPYVSACELVIARLAPKARVLHLCHSTPPGDVRAGALMLERLAPLGPPAVHLAIVDPGVGTERLALCLICARGDVLLGPDNGLLIPAARRLGGVMQAFSISPSRLRETVRSRLELPTSKTFHGRDIFSPAAALLALGVPPEGFAEKVEPARLLPPLEPDTRVTPDGVVATIMEIDHFGNVELSVGLEPIGALALKNGPGLHPHVWCRVRSAGGATGPWQRASLVQVFADLAPGELGVLEDSWGFAALVAGGDSAAASLGARLWDQVEFKGTPS